MTITLPPELEEAITQQARLRGVAPEAAVLDTLREKFMPADQTQDDGPDSLGDWERLLGAADDHLVASRTDE